MSDVNGQYAQALASLYSQLQAAGAGGNTDLPNQPQPTQAQAANEGYYINNPVAAYPMPQGSNGNYANFTPIINNNGQYGGLMNEDALASYAARVLNGAQPDYLNLQMDAARPNIQDTWANADRINNLQTAYNALKNSGR